LLMSEQQDGKHKFLCGHDERHWFVAAVPENRASVANVQTACEALKPVAVQQELNRKQVRHKQRNRCRNEAFTRQGEWFFVPQPGLHVNGDMVLRHEPRFLF